MEIIAFNRPLVIRAGVWLGVMVGFFFLLSLAFWQWQRAADKTLLLNRITQLQSSGGLPVIAMQNLPLAQADGLPVDSQARWISPYVWLLDNQMLNGRPGYDVIIPVQLAQGGEPMLVNFGWIAATENRTYLPVINLPAEFLVQGILRTHLGGFSVGANIEKNQAWPMRIQRVDIAQLNEYFPAKFYRGVIYQMRDSPFQIHYQPVVMSPSRHRAYALQWFLLALALPIVAFAAIENRTGLGPQIRP